jgi:hypothetical protein
MFYSVHTATSWEFIKPNMTSQCKSESYGNSNQTSESVPEMNSIRQAGPI